MLEGLEWDRAKARANREKHRVSFEEAASVFFDLRSLTIYDPDHSEAEMRFLTLGFSDKGRILAVAHADRGRRIRIISARRATKREEVTYAQGNP